MAWNDSEEARAHLAAHLSQAIEKKMEGALLGAVTAKPQEDPGPLTLENLKAAMDSVPAAPPAPPQIVASPHYPRKVTGYRREPIMCHPFVCWLMRLVGGDEQWGWGPWEEITRPIDPVMITDPFSGRRTIVMSLEQHAAVDSDR